MLIIRQEQMDAFKPVGETGFENRVMSYLFERYPDQVVQLPEGEKSVKEISPETLRQMVQRGISRARSYRMTWETSLTSFVMLMFVIAPNFDEHPQINLMLRNDKIEPDKLIDHLCEQATEANWQAARETYDVGSWNVLVQEG